MLCPVVIVSGYLGINQETHIFGIPMCDNPLSIAAVTVFFGMLIGAADPLRKLSGVITNVNNGMAAANLLYPMMDIQSRVVDPANPVPVPSPHQRIDFRDVTFSYDGVHNVLQSATLTINVGDHLAIFCPI